MVLRRWDSKSGESLNSSVPALFWWWRGERKKARSARLVWLVCTCIPRDTRPICTRAFCKLSQTFANFRTGGKSDAKSLLPLNRVGRSLTPVSHHSSESKYLSIYYYWVVVVVDPSELESNEGYSPWIPRLSTILRQDGCWMQAGTDRHIRRSEQQSRQRWSIG